VEENDQEMLQNIKIEEI